MVSGSIYVFVVFVVCDWQEQLTLTIIDHLINFLILLKIG